MLFSGFILLGGCQVNRHVENFSDIPASKTLDVKQDDQGQYVITLPGCPDWSGGHTTYNNIPGPNFGCATATNLGLMVARPEDLVHGRDPGYADGEQAVRSVALYRKGETKALSPEDVGSIESQQKGGEGE